MAKHITIDGLKIEIEDVAPSTDVRFFSQRQLFALGTPEAWVELKRRAEIIRQRAA